MQTPPPTPEPEPPPKPAPSGWRHQVDRLAKAVAGNVVVVRVFEVINVANEAGATLFSAALAFSTMFAIIPLMLLLAGILGWLVEDPVQRKSLLDQLIGYVPPLADFFSATLDDVVAGRGALSLLGIVGLLWGASSFYGGLDEVMRRIFVGGGVRNEFSRRGRGVLTIVVLIVVLIATLSLSSLWAVIDRFVGGFAVLRLLVPVMILAFMVIVAMAVYKLVPTAPPSFRAALPPSIVAGVGIGLLTELFGVLTPLLIGGLSAFGVVATLFGALIWLNFSYQILLYGAAWARIRRDREAAKLAAAVAVAA